MNREEILAALKELSRNLEAKGLKGDIYLVGGAALVVAYDAKRQTRDVDAVFAPKTEVRKAAEEVAKLRGLKDDWINDAVKNYVPGQKDVNASIVLDEPGLRVMAAAAEPLLAMKLLAARREDEADIRFLCDYLKIESADDAIAVLTKYYSDKVILPRSKFMIEEMFETREKEKSPGKTRGDGGSF
jgi:predicted nucleotidyltransferase